MSIIDEEAPRADRRAAADERLVRRGREVVNIAALPLLDTLAEELAREYIRLSSEALDDQGKPRQTSPPETGKE